TEVACFRIAQEAFTNALRHSGATRVELRLACTEGLLVLEVSDNGRGLPPEHRRGLGLVTMRERASQLGGEVGITTPPEGGTRDSARLPLQPAALPSPPPRCGSRPPRSPGSTAAGRRAPPARGPYPRPPRPGR